MGGGDHAADTLAALNAKITDAVLVDTGDIVLVSGANPLTGTLTTQSVIPDGDATRSIGVNGASYLEVISKNVRAGVGQTFTLRDEGGSNSLLVLIGGGIRFDQNVTLNADNVRTIGADAIGLAKVVTNIVRPSSTGSASLLIKDASDTTTITIADAGDMTFNPTGNTVFTSNARFNNGIRLSFGSGSESRMQWDTFQTNPHLILGADSVTNIFLITDQDRIGTLDLGIGTFGFPTLIVHDGSLTTGNWGAFQHDGTDFTITSNAGDIKFAGNFVPDGDGARSIGSAAAAVATMWVRFLRPDSGNALTIFAGNANTAISIGDDGLDLNGAGIDRNFRVKTLNNDNTLSVDGGLDSVGIGVALGTHVAKLDVNGGINIRQIAGAEPVSNVTGLDSNKLGFGTRLWDGAAPQTRTYSIRAEDVSGADDLAELTLSSDVEGGVEADFFHFRHELAASSVNMRASTGLNFRIMSDANVEAIRITTADAITIFRPTTVLDNISFFVGSSGDYVWEYETTNQTNDTLIWGTQGSLGNTVVFTDKARISLDHVVGTPATPTFRYHDGSVTAGNFGSITHDGTNLAIVVNAGDLEVTGNIIPEAEGTRSVGISTAVYGTGWFRNVQPDSGQQLKIRTNGGLEAINVLTGSIGINMTGADLDLVVQGDNDPVLLTTDGGLDRVGVGIGAAGQLGKLHVDQNDATGVIPTLYLDQADLSEEFIEFAATIGVGNPIEAVAAKTMTPSHFLRIDVAGVGHLYLEAGPIA